jgi:hypothetical protein
MLGIRIVIIMQGRQSNYLSSFRAWEPGTYSTVLQYIASDELASSISEAA